MLVKTRGIVLNFIRYRETSIIVRIYTEQLGLQTYIVNSVRKKGPGTRIALFQPLMLLEMVVYQSGSGGITRISEYKCAHPFHTLHYDIRKSSVALFLSEIISASVKEEEENLPLFKFLYQSIVALDNLETGFENFHLAFLMQLAHYLGFGAHNAAEITNQVAFAPPSGHGSQPSVMHFQMFEGMLDELMERPQEALVPNGKVRKELLNILIRFYQLHVDRLGEIKSLHVLSDVLSD
ncbi:DNA repair protein RecO [Adhaeribacter sp. BT258]|uniref:DNA repair protein RecO n=1 Tax=Adhaeribacter terrigena TaxID=2793070 RepID=A0ABS1C569_9BACT|nr:DNA repair protein RecO [Adhaeribacter terrigena]MBK0404533.1 DNA repair protein RecO [Adhaeribacter terrigena]